MTHLGTVTGSALLAHQFPSVVVLMSLVLRLLARFPDMCAGTLGLDRVVHVVGGFVTRRHQDEGGLSVSIQFSPACPGRSLQNTLILWWMSDIIG